MIEYDKRFDECIYDLTWYAIDLVREYDCREYDPRDLFRYIFDIASEFLYGCPKEEQDEIRNNDDVYLDKIYYFAMDKLSKHFGIVPEVENGEQTEISVRKEPEG